MSSSFLDHNVRYSVGFASEIDEKINSPFHFSEESFEGYIVNGRKDFNMDPVEDYFMVKLYFAGQRVNQIASFLNRTMNCICLRLRLLLDIKGHVIYNDVDGNKDGTDKIVTSFYNRAIRFYQFCQEKVIDHMIMELYDVPDPHQALVKLILMRKIVL